MTFEDALRDIEALKNKQLKAIGRGASIVLQRVDREDKLVEVVTETGQHRTRSFIELRKVWEDLCTKPAVHVDAALGGSGSSRNQPETLFASLPYVEYLYIDNKKHITLMPADTHASGTLREMDPIQAQKVKAAIRAAGERAGPPAALIVVADIKQAVAAVERLCGVAVEPVIASPGIYKMYKAGNRFLIVEKSRLLLNLNEGTYVVAAVKLPQGDPLGIDVDEYELLLPASSAVQVLAARSRN
jgi:hypothetical protein